MVHRDPETGRYVSDSHSMARLCPSADRYVGSLGYRIPAADLSGTSEQTVNGEDAEILDFDALVGDDEILEVYAIHLETVLAGPTTATAESAMTATWALRTDYGGIGEIQAASEAFGVNSPDTEEGIVDVIQSQEADDDILASGTHYAEASFRDTSNGTGGGSDSSRERTELQLASDLDSVLHVDIEDEITIPTQIRAQEVDDHAVFFGAQIVLYGRERRIEDC
jgi:hypothetical protein